MGINLHQEREPSRDVDLSDVTQMRSKMNQHSEETNELYNLMARHIKKRCEERINLYTIESKSQSAKAKTTLSDNNQNILMDEQEMDQFILDNDKAIELNTRSPPNEM